VWRGAVGFDASLRLLELARETQMLVWYSPSRLRVNLEGPRSCGAPSCSVSNSVHTEQLGVAAAIADNRCWPLVLQLALAAARMFAQRVFARGLGCAGVVLDGWGGCNMDEPSTCTRCTRLQPAFAAPGLGHRGEGELALRRRARLLARCRPRTPLTHTLLPTAVGSALCNDAPARRRHHRRTHRRHLPRLPAAATPLTSAVP